MSLNASAYSGLSAQNLRQLIDRDPADALPAYRIDRRVLVSKSNVDTYLANYRISGRPSVVAVRKKLA
jgi:hypothetical protein